MELENRKLKEDFEKHLSTIKKFYDKYGDKIELYLLFHYEIEKPFKNGINGEMMWEIYHDEIFSFYVDPFDRSIFWKFEKTNDSITLHFKDEFYGYKIEFDKNEHDDPNEIFSHLLMEYLKMQGIESEMYGFNKMVINYKDSFEEIDVSYICGTI
jgi:hypothetical protein